MVKQHKRFVQNQVQGVHIFSKREEKVSFMEDCHGNFFSSAG